MSDGAIKFDTEMDTTGVKAKLKELKKQLVDTQRTYNQQEKRLISVTKEMEKTSSFSSSYTDLKKQSEMLGGSLDALGTKIGNLQAEIDRLEPSAKLSEEADKLIGKLNTLYYSYEKFQALGKDQNSETFKALEYNIGKYEEKLQAVIGEIGKTNPDLAQSMGASFAGVKTNLAGDTGLSQEQLNIINSMGTSVGALIRSFQTLFSMRPDALTNSLNYLKLSATSAGEAVKGIMAQIGVSMKLFMAEAKAAFQDLPAQIGGKLKGALASLGGLIRSLPRRALSGMKNLISKGYENAKAMFVQNNAARTLGRSIFSLGNMFKMLIIRMAMRALLKATQEGFTNLAAYSNEVNAALSSLKNSTAYLTNSIAASMSGLLTAIAPVFSRLIDMIVTVMNAFGKLIALLTGKSSYTVAIKQNKQLSSAVSGTGSAAKKAAEEEKKALASFDEINQLNLQKDTDTSGSGSSSGGAGAGDLFKEQQIAMDDWMKQLIDNNDWIGLGAAVADKINAAIAQINWEKIGSTIGTGLDRAIKFTYGFLKTINTEQIGSGIGKLLNAAMEKIDSVYIGRSIAQAINRAFDLAYGFLTTFDFSQFGIELSEIINGFFEDIDIARILDTISALFNDIWDFLYSLLTNIDFSQIVYTLSELVFGFFADLFTLIIEGISTYFEPFIEQAQEMGASIVEGILLGILTALINIGEWVYENIFLPFIEAFKTAFGIASPSTVMKTQGQFIMQGLLNGLTSWMGKIRVFFTTLVSNVKNWLRSIITYISTEFFTNWGAVWTSIKDFFSSIWDKWSHILIDNAKNWMNKLLGFVNNDFASSWSDAWNHVKDIFKGIWNGIVDLAERAVNFIIDKLNSLSFDVPSWVPGIGGAHFGFNIPRISLPRLATGTVIPPAAGEFAAILGDNNTDTEVVSPLETIKEALLEAMQESGAGRSRQIVLNFTGDLAELARILKPELENEDDREGTQLVIVGG